MQTSDCSSLLMTKPIASRFLHVKWCCSRNRRVAAKLQVFFWKLKPAKALRERAAAIAAERAFPFYLRLLKKHAGLRLHAPAVIWEQLSLLCVCFPRCDVAGGGSPERASAGTTAADFHVDRCLRSSVIPVRFCTGFPPAAAVPD